jgi:hypothetical protein
MADAADTPRPPAWDTSRMQTLRCDVANATGSAAGVRLQFGRREARPDGASGVSLCHGVALTPYAAKRLQELLAVLVRQHDAS